MNVLIMEERAGSAASLKRLLAREGCEVSAAPLAAAAGACAGRFDVAVLDLAQAGAPALRVLRELRCARPELRVVMLAEGATAEDRVEGLRLGADDFVSKPALLAELSLRIRAAGRRLCRGCAAGAGVRIDVGGLSFDRLSRSVTCNGCEVALSAREFTLLECLARNCGKVLSQHELFKEVWVQSDARQSNLVDVCVCRLREKLGGLTSKPVILTVRGAGYMMACYGGK